MPQLTTDSHEWPHTIPKHIYMSYRTHHIPPSVFQAWKRLNPGFDITLFNDSECSSFIRREYSEQVWSALFDSIPSGPIRSDLWRVLMLYKRGGVYVDVDAEPVVPLSRFVRATDTFVTSGSRNRRRVNPHFLVARAGEPVLNATLFHMLNASKQAKGTFNFFTWSVCPAMYLALSSQIPFFEHNSNKLYRVGGGSYRILVEDVCNRTISCPKPKSNSTAGDGRAPMCHGMFKATTQIEAAGWPQLLMWNKWPPHMWDQKAHKASGIIGVKGSANLVSFREGGFRDEVENLQ